MTEEKLGEERTLTFLGVYCVFVYVMPWMMIPLH